MSFPTKIEYETKYLPRSEDHYRFVEEVLDGPKRRPVDEEE
jgi:hypothetical protein